MTTANRKRMSLGIALAAALALVAAACTAEDTAAQDAAAAASGAAASASSDASAAMAAAQGAQAGADAADARAGAAEAEASAAAATADAAAAAADAAAAAAAEAQAAAELAQATASGSADAIAEAEAALADAQAAAEAASEQAAAAQEEAAAAQEEAAAAQEEAAAAQAEAAAAQQEAAAAQQEAASAQAQVEEMEEAAEAAEAAAMEAYMNPGAGVPVTQARATWSTGYMQAAIYHHLLEELGYDVSEPAEKELANDIFYVALGRGEVDFWANGWMPGHLKFFQAELADGSIVDENVTIIGWQIPAAGLEGLLTNKEIAQEYGIKTVGQINDDPELIALYDATDTNPGDGVVQILVCPDGWTCDDIFAETIEFNRWDNLEAVRAGYEAMFADAVAKIEDGDPVIIYTWSPSGYIAVLIPGDNVVWLSVEHENVLDGSTVSGFDFDDFPPAALGLEYCTNDPCYTGFAAADIRVVANNDFLAANPAARSLFESVTFSVIDIALQNVRYDGGENSTDDVNRHAAEWIEANRAQVDEWLTAARDAA